VELILGRHEYIRWIHLTVHTRVLFEISKYAASRPRYQFKYVCGVENSLKYDHPAGNVDFSFTVLQILAIFKTEGHDEHDSFQCISASATFCCKQLSHFAIALSIGKRDIFKARQISYTLYCTVPLPD